MQLIFLGTASCYPTAVRGVSCTALRLETGDVWLFDCGEGSQIQLQKSSVRPGRITKIFITHLHGDHLFGLPGLICTLGNQVMDRPNFILEIYGPHGIRRYVRESLTLSRSPLPFDYIVHELVPDASQFPEGWSTWNVEHSASENCHLQEKKGKDIKCGKDLIWKLFDEPGFKVEAGPVVHRVPTFGFVVTEKDSPGRLDVELLKTLGVPPGPKYNQIKQGQALVLECGRIINPSEVVGKPKKGRKITILGDTADASAMAELASDSDILIHEATVENALLEKARETGHSTPNVAAAFARRTNARQLILYHFSQRYKTDAEEGDCTVNQLVLEAEKALEGSCPVSAASDLLEMTICRQQDQ